MAKHALGAAASPAQRDQTKHEGQSRLKRLPWDLSTKIHATCEALGNEPGFHLTPGQACDRNGADVLLGETEAEMPMRG